MIRFLFTFLFILINILSYAQRGKDGNLNVTSTNQILNTYTYLTQDVSQGSSTITVASTTGLAPGDLVLIIQMQGALLRSLINSGLFNATWGDILDYNGAGNYEFQQVSIVNPNEIVLECSLKNNYKTFGNTQIIRVPRYDSFTISNGASITCPAWNGQTGGVLAIESLNNTTINGFINTTGKGFRGGQKENASTAPGTEILDMASTDSAYGGDKGEGIGGFGNFYNNYGGRYGRGAAANGGGGGGAHNSGGGGGSNAGIGTWNGLGNPDKGPGNIYVPAWEIENTNFSNNVSTGGGRGGYAFSMYDYDALTTPPGVMLWGGNSRTNNGGLGGKPLSNGINSERVFMGGGGGAGDGNDGASTDGASGGGIVFIISHAHITGTGNILANGSAGALTPPYGNDAPGGGGGGGSILLYATGNISGINAVAIGGSGGTQNISTVEAEGPGGGGGGGYIAHTGGTFNQFATGGNNGLTNSPALSEFPPNGATKGADGLTNQTLTNYTMTATNDTVCAGQNAILSVTLSGSYPVPTTVNWFLNEIGGTPFHTGTIFTTPALNNTTTYYVGACPGTYRVPVTAYVYQLPLANAGNDTLLCIGDSIQLTASGGLNYSWSPVNTLSNPNISNPVAYPISNTTYTVTVTDANGCSNTDDIFVEAKIIPVPGIGASEYSICPGFSTQLMGTPGYADYIWNTGDTTSAITVSPIVLTNYTLTVSDIYGCSGSTAINIHIKPVPVAVAGTDTSVCYGSGVQLTSSGGVSYSWSPGISLNATTISNPVASPSVTTTYLVVVSNTQGCTASDDLVVHVNPLPIISGGTPQSICPGDSTVITATGGIIYQWNTGETTASIIVVPITNTTYSVTGTDALGCSNSDDVVINLFTLPPADAGNDTSICPGSNAQLNASGGINYVWSPPAFLNNTNIANPISTPAYPITYTVTVTDTNGCKNTDNIVVGLYPEPSAFVEADVYAGCSPLVITFNDTNTTNIGGWLWNFGDPNSDTNNISPLPVAIHVFNTPGSYSIALTLTSIHGCSKTSIFNNLITVYPDPIASFDPLPPTTNILNPTITFTNTSVDAVSWAWDFGDILPSSSTVLSPTYSYTEEGIYTVTLSVLSQHGCADTATEEIIIKPEFTFFVPNVFTPDEDGLNDFFKGVGRNFTEYQMYIYDRWGKLIYETNDYDKPWDGKVMGSNEYCMPETYVYKIVVKDFKGRIHNYNGSVILLRQQY